MLRVESVCFEIDKRPLLRDVSFSIRSGEMVAVLGANGAGKSTLMRLLSGEKQPSSGRVVLNGSDLQEYSKKELARQRAMLQQQHSISMAFSVEEIVMMGRYGQFGGSPLEKDLLAVRETMEVCGISHLHERSMMTLSGGEQQRVHLARVLAQLWDVSNGLLLLDEPISNMDIQFQHQTLAIVKALARKGFMVVAVLHDINLAAQYASRILMLKGGRKWWDGQPAEVLTSAHIYTAFSINAVTYTDNQTLKTQILPLEVHLAAGDFNSNMRSDQ
ncbi:heme ABC transporter ATP-binding protein [Pedobacter sp. ISL-68]|nr:MULTISPECIES: heme ABC transporter ATP-binding protein [unclassified Pedobacter]MBT2560146.1 heme ABC transporter ATP-binding protein [Pedobacter sp. ISL-64]MBT2589125.1 heme ABC transporter ATP-binding protein [Pedobacter sp. ISL-68]